LVNLSAESPHELLPVGVIQKEGLLGITRAVK
jgi:hypothetical protein